MSLRKRIDRLEKRTGDTKRFESVYVDAAGAIWRDATHKPITEAELEELRKTARVHVSKSNIDYRRL